MTKPVAGSVYLTQVLGTAAPADAEAAGDEAGGAGIGSTTRSGIGRSRNGGVADTFGRGDGVSGGGDRTGVGAGGRGAVGATASRPSDSVPLGVRASRRSSPALAASGRVWGSFVRSAMSAGARGPASSGPRGSSFTMATMVGSGPSLMNGGTPSTAKYSAAPSDHRSLGAPTTPPAACSGDM